MAHVCPWWLGYFLVNPLRRLVESPTKVLGPHVRPGMVVVEPGCGMGFFTLELVRMVGPSGRVVALDVQPRMLAGLQRRARRAGLQGRVEARLVPPDRLGIEDLAGQVDLALALHLVHELTDPDRFFTEVRAALKPGGALLVVEPKGHVKQPDFAATLERARAAGLAETTRPAGVSGWAALLRSARG